MSVHVISWVLKNSETALADRLVLIVIADHANANGENSYPSIPTIARDANLSERQVYRCLKNLESGGHIVATGETRLHTKIWSVPTPDKLSPLTNCHPDKLSPQTPDILSVPIKKTNRHLSNRPILAPERSPESIIAYGETIGLSRENCEAFIDHFQSNGWRVSGKTPMKDWQAALRNWKRRIPAFKRDTVDESPKRKPEHEPIRVDYWDPEKGYAEYLIAKAPPGTNSDPKLKSAFIESYRQEKGLEAPRRSA